MQRPQVDPKAAAEAARRYEAVAAEMEATGPVKRVKMMGMPSLKAGTKMFAGLYLDCMTFKLGAGTPELAEALSLKGARLFDPSGSGRAMKDWAQVPVAHAGRWTELARVALDRLLEA